MTERDVRRKLRFGLLARSVNLLGLDWGGPSMTTNERTVGRYLRWVLAALSLGAGVIHFAVSGDHYNLSLLHGTFFAVTAWLQLSYAVAVIIRPNKLLLQAGVLLNAGIVGVWVLSRVWGVPIGPEAWTPEAVGLADLLWACWCALRSRSSGSVRPLRTRWWASRRWASRSSLRWRSHPRSRRAITTATRWRPTATRPVTAPAQRAARTPGTRRS